MPHHTTQTTLYCIAHTPSWKEDIKPSTIVMKTSGSGLNQWTWKCSQTTLLLLIDLKKAFNTVDHQILLNKLKVYRLSGNKITLFELYLENRKQYCKVKGQTFNSQPNILGVPQGSCLVPLHFLLYFKDLLLKCNASMASMYADDTNISFSSNSIFTISNVVN